MADGKEGRVREIEQGCREDDKTMCRKGRRKGMKAEGNISIRERAGRINIVRVREEG